MLQVPVNDNLFSVDYQNEHQHYLSRALLIYLYINYNYGVHWLKWVIFPYLKINIYYQ